jgi:hypothetical protein
MVSAKKHYIPGEGALHGVEKYENLYRHISPIHVVSEEQE